MTEEFVPTTKLEPIFPVPLYSTNRKLELSETEKKEIEDIISEGMDKNVLNSHSKNSYIFDTKLQEIKEFCNRCDYETRIVTKDFVPKTLEDRLLLTPPQKNLDVDKWEDKKNNDDDLDDIRENLEKLL